jgi:hypothetical protein
MILALAAKGKKTIACVMLALIYFEAVIPAYALGKPANVLRRPVMKEHYRMPAMMAAPVASIAPVAASVAVSAKGAGGPTQPETEGFHSVSNDNMVDLFSGDFSYTFNGCGRLSYCIRLQQWDIYGPGGQLDGVGMEYKSGYDYAECAGFTG